MHSKVVKFDHLKFDGLRGIGHKDRYVGSLVYRESVVPVPMILKDEYDAKLRKKEEIISSLQSIIDRLIKLFESMEGNAAAKVMSNLIKNKERLNNL